MGNSDKSGKRRTVRKRTRRFGKNISVDKENSPPISTSPLLSLTTTPTPPEQAPPLENNNEETISDKREAAQENDRSPKRTEDFNFIMNSSSLKKIFAFAQSKCDGCGNHLTDKRTIKIDTEKKLGFCQHIIISCTCGETKSFFSSQRIDPLNDKSRFDVNIRSVIAFRELGLEYTPL